MAAVRCTAVSLPALLALIGIGQPAAELEHPGQPPDTRILKGGPVPILTDRKPRPWTIPQGGKGSFTAAGYYLGPGGIPFEVAVATSPSRPTESDVRNLWKRRKGNQPSPLLLVVLWHSMSGERATVCGATGDEPAVYSDRDPGQVGRIAKLALGELDQHAAVRFLAAYLPEESGGLRNISLFATHHLVERVPMRSDWPELCNQGAQLVGLRREQLVRALGFTVEPKGQAAILRAAGQARALAIFLDDSDNPDATAARFNGMTPVSWAIGSATADNIPYVVVTRGPQIRIYTTRAGAGAAGKGGTGAFIEFNLALLTVDDAGYLPLLCAAESLAEGGRFESLLSDSQDFAADLGVRLRSRVYEHAVPRIAQALIKRHDESGADTDDESLARLYDRALLILFRLLFVAYAEDRDLLPLQTNGLYRQRSLKHTARELADQANVYGRDFVPFDENATDLWDNARTLWRAVDLGRTDWNVPPYNGGMFSTEPTVNPEGAALANISLTNAEFGPALLGLLVDESDGAWGPVDFASLDVREFGTIYEGLLESDLAVALFDLKVDEDDNWVPAGPQDDVVVSSGGVYLHDRSGARKATGSYFTKPFAVNHLLDHALEPALDTHIGRLAELAATGDTSAAAQAFFDFRCIDLAMGSGHFLVAAVDRIERRLSRFLSEHRLPGVLDELARLADAARDNLEGAGVISEGADTNALLRRQIARRCVYGVDLNQTAVELARLALWIHTFVKGLPLTSLNRSLVVGNSLSGLSTIGEVSAILDHNVDPSAISLFSEALESAMAEAAEAVERFSATSEANAAEVRSARKAHEAATQAMVPVLRLFDYALAVRLGLEPRPLAITSSEMYRKADEFDSAQLRDLQPVHFPVKFPEVLAGERGGFDCILGNPPYDKVRHEPQQFWVKRFPGLRSLPAKQQDLKIESLRLLMPTDAAIELREMAVRERMQQLAAVSFSFQGKGQHGHHDLAKMFVERALTLLSPAGCLGYVLPRTALVIGGWTDIRKALVHVGSLEIIQARNKTGWLFEDVHNQLMFALLTVHRGILPAILTIWPDVSTAEQVRTISPSDAISMTAEEVEELTDKYVIPWFSTPEDVKTFDKLKARTRRLGELGGWISGRADSSRWDFSGSGPHKKYLGRNAEGAWQVLMTRHVDAYRIAVEDAFQRHIPVPLALVPLSRGVENQSGHAGLSAAHPTIVYRYPSMNDNSRTLIATALPDQGYLFSKGYVSGVVTPDSTQRDVMALLALMNSWTCDWWVRRFVDRHVTKQIVENIPLPDWDESNREHVAGLASFLLEGVEMLPGCRRVPTMADCRSKTDALVDIEMAVLDGLSLDETDLMTILGDFSDKGCPPAVRSRLIEEAGHR